MPQVVAVQTAVQSPRRFTHGPSECPECAQKTALPVGLAAPVADEERKPILRCVVCGHRWVAECR